MNQALNTPPNVLPLPWANVPEFSTKEGAPLELVQLSDVLTWRMQCKNQRFAPAVLALLDDLSGFEGLSLYAVEQSGIARAVGDSETFGLDSPRQGRRVISAGIGGGFAPAVQRLALPNGVMPGALAALYVLRLACDQAGAADSFMASNSALSCLAVPCKQAAKLWGAGYLPSVVAGSEMQTINPPKNWTELVQFRSAHKHALWTDEMRRILKNHDVTEKAKPASKGVRAAMGKSLGITSKRVGQLIRELENPAKSKRTGTR